jgi:hypothetical protein
MRLLHSLAARSLRSPKHAAYTFISIQLICVSVVCVLAHRAAGLALIEKTRLMRNQQSRASSKGGFFDKMQEFSEMQAKHERFNRETGLAGENTRLYIAHTAHRPAAIAASCTT